MLIKYFIFSRLDLFEPSIFLIADSVSFADNSSFWLFKKSQSLYVRIGQSDHFRLSTI